MKLANKDAREGLITLWNSREIARDTSMHQIVREYRVRERWLGAFELEETDR